MKSLLDFLRYGKFGRDREAERTPERASMQSSIRPTEMSPKKYRKRKTRNKIAKESRRKNRGK